MTRLPPLDITQQTRIRRLPQYQQTDRREMHSMLDEALIAHLAIVRDGAPIVLPVGFVRDGDSILIHGSSGSEFFRRLADGAAVCVTVTHLDGLVFARSLFDSSMRYRSVIIHGIATPVAAEHKEAALLALSQHLMPGREREVRPIAKRELAATLVLRVPLESVSVKDNRASSAEEPGDGEDRRVWAGILPVRLAAGEAEVSELTIPGTPVSPSVRAVIGRLNHRL